MVFTKIPWRYLHSTVQFNTVDSCKLVTFPQLDCASSEFHEVFGAAIFAEHFPVVTEVVQ